MFYSPKAQAVVEQCEALIATKEDAWSIDRASAVFLMQIGLLRRAKNIVEVGTSYGHSGLFLADVAARHRGKFFTCEKENRKVLIARQFFLQAGLDQSATVLEGDALVSLANVPDQIDLAFLDATKSQTIAYFDIIAPKLADRAVVVTDNISTHGAEMQEFLKRLRADGRFVSSLVPIGHGMELTVKIG